MNKRVLNNAIVITYLLVISLLFCFPLFNSGLAGPQDTRFHLGRILSMGNVWHSPVNFLTFAHHGNMINPYYPWLTIYPAYLLVKLTGSLATGYKLFIVLITFLTAVSAYYSFMAMKHQRTAALVFASVYTFAAYRSVNVFLRGALGETLCALFLPIAFLGLYQVLRGNWRKWPLLTAGMTLILYTHLLTVALSVILCAIFAVLALPQMDHRLQRITAGIKAAGMTVLLSLAFILPFLQMSRAQKVALPVRHLLERGVLSPSALFTSSLNNDWSHYGLGITVLIALIYALTQFRKLNGVERTLLATALGMILLLTTLFPIALFDKTPVASIQFIWRLNAFTTLFVLYIACSHLPAVHSPYAYGLTLLLLTGALLSVHYTSFHAVRAQTAMFFPSGLVYNDNELEGKMQNYAHEDYRPDGALNPAYVTDFRPRLAGKVQKLHAHYTQNTASFTVTNHGRSGQVLRTSVYRYASQLVKLNGKPIATSSVDGMTGVRLPHGTAHITITYRNSRTTIFARIISLVTLILWGLFPVLRRRYLTPSMRKPKHASI
ncbi:6-pyruvoyl-tetrahydropterin synthase-related protein [Lacticaseibacillus zhaodongensis]|uniref:6-pyruvoyl-tetrahydropterin synthase-related protein n=1 Tax=Lacticaseibacillus zhaodongensis TaxID=2668065 RepID=UPI0012D2E0DE|nr:6-pyruvoyl-tetrahydropterin synthase-related protein [Lacticaseibacillus zhaodongensis]